MGAFLIGTALGAVHFGGLYFSVTKLTHVKYPQLLMGLSLIVRMGLLLGVFYLLSKSGFQSILFALLGLMVARFIITMRVKQVKKTSDIKG